jgi:glycosyltransferase involved in cell wall biosynthesis
VPRARARDELDLPHNAVVVGFVGRLVEQKAPDVLLRAFARAVRSAPQLRLAVVGAGPLMAAMQELAVELRVAHRVLWLGERDARTVIEAFDVFAISSRKEGLPYVVLEAMAAGMPVVATRSAGVELLVEGGVNGAVVAPGDVAAFGEALAALANDPRRRSSFGEASRQLVAHFSIDAMVEKTLRAYDPPVRRPHHDDPRPCVAQRGLFGPPEDLTGDLA